MIGIGLGLTLQHARPYQLDSVTADFVRGIYKGADGNTYANFAAMVAASQASFSRGSVAQAFSAAGLMQSFSSGVARITTAGLLLEATATNEVPTSNSWATASGAAIAQNATGLSGAANEAWTATEFLTLSTQAIKAGSSTAAIAVGTTTQTTYITPLTATRCQMLISPGVSMAYANFGLTGAGSVLANSLCTATIKHLPNGQYKCSITYTAIAAAGVAEVAFINSDTATRAPVYTGTGLTLVVQQADIVAGSVASSPIITTGAALTRSADACSLVVPTGKPYMISYDGGTLTGTTSGTSLNLVATMAAASVLGQTIQKLDVAA